MVIRFPGQVKLNDRGDEFAVGLPSNCLFYVVVEIVFISSFGFPRQAVWSSI